jgi:hypothetical protein
VHDSHTKKPCLRNAGRFASDYTRGVISSLRELCGPIAALGAMSIAVQFHDGRVVQVSRTYTTYFDTRGAVIKTPDALNRRIYGYLQNIAIRDWIRFGTLNITFKNGTITEIRPSPTFCSEEIESLL